MSSQDPRIEAIFHEALARAPAERAAFVAEACAGDEALQQAVHRLLAADEEAGTYFESPNSPEIEAELARLKPEEEGEVIGRYKLLQEIGQGGFGTVWMAEQLEPVSRRVALKILKMGMDTREVIGRFEQERQALAMMDHPNIAKVFDAGATPVGRPYFVMELVKGIPITEFCDERQLDTRQRLELFADVCAAINHAHQKGVIHRDIKPSNVMITLHGEKPVVKVIDFGIAKATQGKLTDKTLFTRFEQFIGTPVYMSPEQAGLSALDIDTRSDIYALGVLLYELLTGKPPFDAKSLVSAGYDEMRRIIREEEPPRPSSRLSTVKGEECTALAKARQIIPEKLGRLVEPDLDWIVMRAIEKDRSRRYETANGLALDVQRYLADEPVSARPPTVGYKFRKFARRNKSALSVAAAIAAMLVAATAILTKQVLRATKAEDLADNRLVEALRLIEQLLTLNRNVNGPEHPDTLKTMSDLANSNAEAGHKEEALKLREEVLKLRRKVSGLEHPDTLKAMIDLANSYAEAGRRDEALKLREKVLPPSRKMLGPEHLYTLRAMRDLAISYVENDRPAEALPLREEILRRRINVNGPEHPDTIEAMSDLASSYAESGSVDEALKLREEVLNLRRKVLDAQNPDNIAPPMDEVADSDAGAGESEELVKQGLMWSKGDGIPRDVSKAAAHFQAAVDRGSISGAFYLGECYLKGLGVPQDLDRGIELVRRASDAGFAPAMDLLGSHFHQTAAPLDKNPAEKNRLNSEAFRLFTRASELGYARSFANLAVLYLNGDGTPRDYQTALQLIEEGNSRGDAFSMFLYARCLESGIGVRRNEVEAKLWYQKAAEAGNEGAIKWLEANGGR